MSERRGPLDRFQHDADELDEIMLSNVTFHIERMSHHGWWLGVRDPVTGDQLSIWWSATAEPVLEYDEWLGAERIRRDAVIYGCPHRWTDARGADHRCEVGDFVSVREHSDHKRHRCECGATTKAEDPA